jgi:predicted O-linked N-acetylglucosamine transferase (SPINDLY family)
MPTIAEALNLALQHHQAGRLQEAEILYRQVLQTQPDHPDALHLLGLLAHHVGRHDAAVELIGKAIALNPAAAEFHNNLGEAYRAQGKREKALGCYRQALALKPDCAEVHYNLGILLADQGKVEEAILHYRHAIALKPAYAEAFNNLGNALNEQGRSEEAMACFRQALALRPDFAEACNNLGTVLKDLGMLDEAKAHYRQALALKPAFAAALNNLGAILNEQGQLEEAIACYNQALALKSVPAEVCVNLGNALKEQGKRKEAEAAYRRALEIQPHDAVRVLIASVLPVIADSKEHLLDARRCFTEGITELLHRKLTIEDPVRQVGTTNFYLAYQGLDDREIQQTVSRLYEQACPSLDYRAAHCQTAPPASAGGKIKVGFISRLIGNQTITRALMSGIIEKLSRRTFAVSVFSFPHARNADCEQVSRCADHVVVLPPVLDAARDRIAREQLDILCYVDIGMDPLTYFLAFSRLAPVQCATWQHPVTTGIRTIDYFISSENLEPESADTHYSERLVRLKHMPTYYSRPTLPSPLKSRRELGVDGGKTLYLCPQSLYKLHPDFDEVIAGVLRADQHGRVFLINGIQQHWTELLVRRFQKTIPDVVERIHFLPRLTSPDFHCLLAGADVILDPLYWSGGITTLDALAFGTPIVTLPSAMMRGRVTYGCYTHMGVLDCVATTKKDYVKRAVRMGTDSSYRERIKAKILANNHVLYENIEAVREIERFFLQATKKRVQPPTRSPRKSSRSQRSDARR